MTEWLDVNCSSPNSKPPAQLKWYINNEPADPNYLMQQAPFRNPRGLYTSALQMRFKLRRTHFHQASWTCIFFKHQSRFISKWTSNTGLHLNQITTESNEVIFMFLKSAPWIQGHVAIKCTAQVYSQYFESSEHYLPGLDLREKALLSRATNGE